MFTRVTIGLYVHFQNPKPVLLQPILKQESDVTPSHIPATVSGPWVLNRKCDPDDEQGHHTAIGRSAAHTSPGTGEFCFSSVTRYRLMGFVQPKGNKTKRANTRPSLYCNTQWTCVGTVFYISDNNRTFYNLLAWSFRNVTARDFLALV